MWQHVQQSIGSISITREDMTTKDSYAYQVEPLRKSGVSPHLRWYLRFPSLPSNFITLDLLPRGATCWKTVVLSWGSALCEDYLFLSYITHTLCLTRCTFFSHVLRGQPLRDSSCPFGFLLPSRFWVSPRYASFLEVLIHSPRRLFPQHFFLRSSLVSSRKSFKVSRDGQPIFITPLKTLDLLCFWVVTLSS